MQISPDNIRNTNWRGKNNKLNFYVILFCYVESMCVLRIIIRNVKVANTTCVRVKYMTFWLSKSQQLWVPLWIKSHQFWHKFICSDYFGFSLSLIPMQTYTRKKKNSIKKYQTQTHTLKLYFSMTDHRYRYIERDSNIATITSNRCSTNSKSSVF